MIDLNFIPETREPIVKDGVGYLLLTQSKIAYFDPEMLDIFPENKYWYAVKSCNTYYAQMEIPKLKNNKRQRLRLHNLVLPTESNLMVDHINGNGLDNRLINLRKSNNRQNAINSPPRPNRSSKYKGVLLKRNRWVAKTTYNYKSYNIGSFINEMDAALAYDKRVKELHGEYPWINQDNFPELLEYKNYIESNP